MILYYICGVYMFNLIFCIMKKVFLVVCKCRSKESNKIIGSVVLGVFKSYNRAKRYSNSMRADCTDFTECTMYYVIQEHRVY